MKRTNVLAVFFAAAAGMSAAHAQSVLKFSHTDQPGGTRQTAAEMFAQSLTGRASARSRATWHR